MFRDISPHVNVDELERGILAFWEKEKIFERSLEQNKDREHFTFYDGPPYATGKPHYGHILQSAIKDAVLRYKTMRGYFAPRRVGWDCHGLPVEVLVEKELGVKTKRDIEEKVGIEQFNKKCREAVTRFVKEFTDTLKRVGRWADYDNAYFTLNREYMETEWWVFQQLWDAGLIYKAFRSTPYCIRCATPLSNYEVTSNYQSTVDRAVYVLLPAFADASAGEAGRQPASNLYLLVWTTTPWTLPGNVAVAINPNIAYVSVVYGDCQVIVAENRVASVFGEDVKIARRWMVDELTALQYRPPYPEVIGALATEKDNAFTVVISDHVTADDGTGLVHIAPAFGEEDADVGKIHRLPVLRTVDTQGHYVSVMPRWGGKLIFHSQQEIVRDLKQRDLLFREEDYEHSYPFCWRCDTPLIYYALDTWFLRVSELRERMLAINEYVNWIPQHVKHGRFAKGIESAPDWAISRNRFWSVPLPIWECDSCGERVVVGSVGELQKLSGEDEISDLHRPYVDEISWRCEQCSRGMMKRIPEVLDVWFDSACMPYSQWHYPFERKEFVEKGFPADFIAESIEMTRAWFYVLHVVAVALTTKDIGLGKDQSAYKNVIASGLIFAEDGQKLSKKLKNYPEPEPTIRKYGADALRLYLLSSATLGEPYRFSEKDLQQLYRNVYSRLWNVYSFFVRYANTYDWKPEKDAGATSGHILDRWIRARLKKLAFEVIEAADTYHIDVAARLFVPFIDDLSNWYVRRSRSRFQHAATHTERNESFSTLHHVLISTAKLLAPFVPFVAEEIYRNLTGKDSVHLEELSAPQNLSAGERELLEGMSTIREQISFQLAARAAAGFKIRQVLGRSESLYTLPYESLKSLTDDFEKIFEEELNVKEHRFVSALPKEEGWIQSSDSTALNIHMTQELEAEGIAREIIRHGQVLRKKAGYALNDRITFIISADDSTIRSVVEQQRVVITRALQADKITEEGPRGDVGADVRINGALVHLGVVKE